MEQKVLYTGVVSKPCWVYKIKQYWFILNYLFNGIKKSKT